MPFFVLILFLLTFQVSAGTKHLIFQVNGTLVQELSEKYPLNHHQQVVINEFREVRSFAVYEGVSELLYALYSHPEVVIHFADSDTDLARKILAKVRVHKYRLNQFMKKESRLFTLPYKGSVDFAKEFKGEDFLFISSRSRDGEVTDTLHTLKVSQQFNFFEKYQDAQKARASSYSKDNYPGSWDEWIISMKRSFLWASIILPQLGKKQFLNEVHEFKNTDPHVLLKNAVPLAENLFLERIVKFKGNRSLTSCSVFNLYNGKTERDLSLEDCSRYFGEHLHIDYDVKRRTCDISTFSQKLKGVFLDSCLSLKRYEAIFSFDLKTCSAFDTKKRRLSDLPLAECQGQGIYVYEPQNKVYLFGTYKRSYLSMPLEKIIKDIWPLPENSNLLRVWFPWQRNESIGFSWRDCVDDLEGGHPVRNLEASAHCRGDTFYSWGSLHKIESLKKVMGKGPWETTMQALYLARTPLSSFGYGPYAVRVKVRPDVLWKRIDYQMTPCSSGDIGRTIFFRSKAAFASALFDIIICSPEVIESWSYGTREHYDELVKDVEWTILKKRSEELTEMYINDPQFLRANSIDGMDFRVEGIYPRLQNHLQLSRQTGGEIFFNSFSSQRTDHFGTKYPIYFNED